MHRWPLVGFRNRYLEWHECAATFTGGYAAVDAAVDWFACCGAPLLLFSLSPAAAGGAGDASAVASRTLDGEHLRLPVRAGDTSLRSMA